jgi:hypothetical protein
MPPAVEALAVSTDVKTFIDRRMGCNHWSGEGSEEKARTLEIRRAMIVLRCEKLSDDERTLRAHHAKTPAVAKTLDETREWMW